jgi:hemerythrin
MSFTSRILTGNAVVILTTVGAISLGCPKNHLPIVFGICLAMLAGSSFVLWLLCRSAFAPLTKVTHAIEKAAGGDLSVRVAQEGFGEMARLGIAFNTMMNDMNKAMRQFFSVADLVRDSVGMVSGNTSQMVAAAEDVAMQAGTIATASEEMAATSADIARNCLFAAENARTATQQTNNGASLVLNSTKLMDNIAKRVNESSRTVAGLGDRSDQIGAIVNTIEDIADQTNLLALNAAIEAARAGEQGRGFSVVADEVRALAERTTKATKEISSMIKSIQAETQIAVGSMSEGVNEVKRGTSEAARSGEALEDIIVKIDELTMQVGQIATAAEEQTATTHEITNNIHLITTVVNQNVESARGTTAATQMLSRQVDELHALVGNFRLSNVLEWDDSFATGVAKFDQQHMKLFDMVNELHDAMQKKRSKEAIGSILNRLIEYTGSHFAQEEEAFKKASYPDEVQHKQHHSKLVGQVLELHAKFNSGEALLTHSVIEFLQDWLINHIKGVDKLYGPCLNKNGI